MRKNFFIIGIRRSGTTIIKELVQKHPDIMTIEFEPHHLWAAVDLHHFKRLMNQNKIKIWVSSIIQQFRKHGELGKWYGAKFALNPGTKALEWVWLHKTFPDARFIFIVRKTENTWKSVYKQDANSVRGIIDKRAYEIMSENLKKDFQVFADQFPKKAVICSYEKLLNNPFAELSKVWRLLGLDTPNIDFKQFIRRPENV